MLVSNFAETLGTYGARIVFAELVTRNVTATMVTAAIAVITTIAHFRIFIISLYLF